MLSGAPIGPLHDFDSVRLAAVFEQRFKRVPPDSWRAAYFNEGLDQRKPAEDDGDVGYVPVGETRVAPASGHSVAVPAA